MSSSESRWHRKEVLEVLARMLEKVDPNGLDLIFTAPYKKLKRQNTDGILREFDATDHRDRPNMSSCIAKILESYQKKIGKFNFKEFARRPRSMPLVGPRKLSLYVLTDGIWRPGTDLVDEIRMLVDNLADKRLAYKQVGIQFIRVGNNPQAIGKMERLASGRDFKLYVFSHSFPRTLCTLSDL